MTQASCFRASFSRAARKTRTALALVFSVVSGQVLALDAVESQAPPAPIQQNKSYLQMLYEGNGGVDAATLSGEALKKAFLEKNCSRADAVLAEEKPNYNLLQSLKMLEKSSAFGAALVKEARENGVQFCALQALPTDMAGQYQIDINAVLARSAEPSPLFSLTLAHEIHHAGQGKAGLINYYYDWDIESRVRRSLTIEAAAAVTEFLVAWQAAEAGNPDYWRDLQHGYVSFYYGDQEMYRVIENTWRTAVASGVTQDEALRQTGLAAWNRIFAGDDFLRFYLNRQIQALLTEIQSGAIKSGDRVNKNGFGQDKVDLAGTVGKLVSFTKGAIFPPLDALLARDQKMKWTFEAVVLFQHEKVFGKGSSEARALREKALAGNNPYLVLNLENISAQVHPALGKASGHAHANLYQRFDEELKKHSAADVTVARQQLAAPVP